MVLKPVWIEYVEAASTAILAIFTIILAIATIQYKNQSENQTKEMALTRKTEIRPVLKPYITKNFTGNMYWLEIRNIGKGSAQEITANWYVEGWKEQSVNWSIPLIPSTEYHQFEIPIDKEEIPHSELKGTVRDHSPRAIRAVLDGTDRDLVLDIKYKDPLGNEFGIGRTCRLPILEALSGRDDSNEIKFSEDT
jgi:hypothetical protein